MKKNIVTFLIAVGALVFTTHLSAQDQPLSFGIKAATNLSIYRLGGDMEGFKSKMSIGGSFGAFVKYDLSNNFALQSGIDATIRLQRWNPQLTDHPTNSNLSE